MENIKKISFKTRTKKFLFKNNTCVYSIEISLVKHDCCNDTNVYNITVLFRNGDKYTWSSNIVSEYGNGLFVDTKGEFLFGCSLKGIYCLELKTGKKIWQKRKMSKFIVMNPNNTMTCKWNKELYIIDIKGDIVKSIKTNYEVSVFYIGNDMFLIRRDKFVWNIVSPYLENVYIIPNHWFLSKIRTATINDNTLFVKYWDETYNDTNKCIINLVPYKVFDL